MLSKCKAFAIFVKKTLERFFKAALLWIAVMVSLGSCKKNNSDPTTYFIATISSASQTTTQAFGTVSEDSSNSGSGAIGIHGANLDQSNNPVQIINIILQNFSGPGTYNIDGTGTYAYATYSPDGNPGYVSKNGSITITAVQPYLTGTFNFTTTDSTRITSGKFSVPFR